MMTAPTVRMMAAGAAADAMHSPCSFASARRPVRALLLTATLLAAVPFSGLPVLAGSLQSERANAGQAVPGRIAIVIGNQEYEAVSDLENARRDARDVADMLRSFRFNVFDGYDLDKRGFEELLRSAMLNIPDGAEVVFYYAGHGIQIGRRNYLLPTDAAFASIYDVPLETMTLDRVIDTLAARGAAHVAILDSCRDNPFPDIRLAADLDANLFETKSGFDVFSTPLNSLVAFSTSPGAVAMDGAAGGNSPYTRAIMEAAQAAPGENIQNLFPVVRRKVHEATEGRQVPWESSTLVQPFFLAPASVTAADTSGQADAGTGSADRGMVIAAPSDEPTALEPIPISLTRVFDRRVVLGDEILDAIGGEFVAVEMAVPPTSGILSLGAGVGQIGRVSFAPEISDIRATELDGFELEERFSLNFVLAGGLTRQVDVNLKLEVDSCDLEMGDALDLGGIGIYRLANEIDVAAGLAACERAVAEDPESGRFHYQLGRAQQSAGQVPEAFASFSRAAELGHVRALNALSILHGSKRIDHEALGIPKDPELALSLLERGIATGDPYPMHRLGQQLLRQGETPQDRQRGFELMERAVELGHTYSMNELGIYFLTKDTDHYLPERGMRYLRASELRKDIYGYHNLGYVALNGLDGVEPDTALAQEYFRKSMEGGHPSGPSMLARMILRGQIGERNPSEAVKFYDMSLARGDGWAGANAATLILKGEVPGLGEADAAVRAAKAANLGNAKAAERARERLAQVSAREKGRALQMLLAELGQPISVDGAVGPQTLRALEAASADASIPYRRVDDPTERLILAARVYWSENPVRFDLF
ncbi:caspase family protein [Tropicimonas sp. TH_r6]|uniref:caspase family protein n=1 Tax=Tropicimonas sp. TH_r6 TaxID=3082085 RepID=UPI002952A3E1|nr:caspase family protein [Tropicimonas sp. TH_r6]MDV7143201.1 caspase family protein [Tropicimonas sp. TH_r6]